MIFQREKYYVSSYDLQSSHPLMKLCVFRLGRTLSSERPIVDGKKSGGNHDESLDVDCTISFDLQRLL